MTKRQRARQLAVAGAAAALVAASVTACDTYQLGSCKGSVKLIVGGGLVTASASAVCFEQPPSAYSLILFLYADGLQVQQASSNTVPDTTGYVITTSVVCTTASYVGKVIAVATSQDGIVSSAQTQTSRTISKQGQCS